MAGRTFSTLDEIYLKSTSFEVFMMSGAFFVVLFSLSFMVGNALGAAWLIWPGIVVGVLAAFGLHLKLAQREHRAKLTELEAEYRSREAVQQGD